MKFDKVKSAVLELNKINKDFKSYEEEYKSRKEELTGIIKQYAKEKRVDDFYISLKDTMLKVKPIVNKKIIWNFDELHKKVDKSLLKQFIEKEYIIEDFDGLVEYLKSCGVNPKKFKNYLTVKETVNKKNLDNLSDLGEITEQDIKGCYTIEITSGYVKISELEE